MLSPATLRDWVDRHAPVSPTPARPLLLAVSGGCDSMTLWRLIHDTGLPYAISHVAYGLRPEQNPAELALLRATAAQRAVALYVDEAPLASGPSVQARARAARRAFWRQRLCDHAALVLAHHADDQAETILMRLTRGSGPVGLTGMRAVEGSVLRPLLGVSAAEIRAFAKTQGVAFVDDRSNASHAYARNRFRHLVIPPLVAAEPRALEGISHSVLQQAELVAFAQGQWQALLARARLAAKPLPPGSDEVIAGPFDRAVLAETQGLGAGLGLWLVKRGFSPARITDIGAGVGDGQPRRRGFYNNDRSEAVVIAGQRVWLQRNSSGEHP